MNSNNTTFLVEKGMISLLWPQKKIEKTQNSSLFFMDQVSRRDIELERLVQGFGPRGKEMNLWLRLLGSLCSDPDIIKHRQDVFADMYNHPQLVKILEDLLPDLEALKKSKSTGKSDDNLIYTITSRLGELEGLARIVTLLMDFFSENLDDIISSVFKELAIELEKIYSDPHFQQMMEEVPELLEKLRNVRSVTIGVNLNQKLQPVQATLLAVNTNIYTAQSNNVLNRLMGKASDEFQGIAQLHSVPSKILAAKGTTLTLDAETYGYAINPLMVPLFKDLNEVLKKTIIPISKALRKYGKIRGHHLSAMSDEIPFFLGGLRMLKAFEAAGLPVCCPEILQNEKRITRLTQAYNPNLALALLAQGQNGQLASPVVLNDVDLNQTGRIQIITGPNQGGKTTYIQAVAHCHLLFQSGFFVPAAQAAMSPVDCLCTHFPSEEKIDRGRGRLGDEAHRFSHQFEIVTPNSLFLLNESFSSTYSGESLYMAQDILKILLKLGTRTLFATHLHELAARYEELNQNSDYTDRCVSMVSQVRDKGEERRTYHIVPGPPLGHSYAQEIAEKYGIAYKQLDENLKKRGVFVND